MTSDVARRGRAGDRLIRSDERSGVLNPRNLERYDARWLDSAPAVDAVVAQYWHVRWRLDAGEAIEQRIIDFPAVTLTVEEGDVPAPLVVTGVQRGAWRRLISGCGAVFAIRLRPAGLAVLSDLSPRQIADATVPVTPQLDVRLHSLLMRIAAERNPEARARAADAAIAEASGERPFRPAALLANAVVDELARRLRARTTQSLADHFGVSERTVQRSLHTTLGRGPKWVSRRVRLQEIARLLATETDLDLATLAVDLGYTDQAHLINDFRAVAGVTPGWYRRSLLRITAP